jgi:superfamily I DNA/RNA helicase
VAKTLKEIRSEIDNLPMKQLTLTGNYRSNQRIIDYYTHFQTQKIDIKALGKNSTEKGLITFNNSVHYSNLAPEIAKLIQLSLDKGIPEDEICVLVPQWWLVISLAKKLKELLPTVNFDASGLTPMSKNRENIWYKLSRLFLTIPSPKIYSLRYKWATELIELFKNEINGDFKESYMTERNFLKLINSIKSNKTEGVGYLNDCFDQFLSIVEIDINQYTNLLLSREIYFNTIEKRLQEGDPKFPSDIESFKGFYKEMTGVVINTCVGIKGEEFETVISYGLLYGYIPHWSDIISGDPISSSKKLMYVICSRAKTNLHLLSETGRKTQKGKLLDINPELKSKVFSYDQI